MASQAAGLVVPLLCVAALIDMLAGNSCGELFCIVLYRVIGWICVMCLVMQVFTG